MNANELADYITKNVAQAVHGSATAATMLRQQQEKLTKYELRHAEQRKRIDELEAYQKHDVELAEAVGWDKGYEAGRQLGMKQERALWELAASTQEIMDTHPVKELTLTNDEIEDCFPDNGCSSTEDGFGLVVSAQFLHDFARAILLKAQEK